MSRTNSAHQPTVENYEIIEGFYLGISLIST